MKTRYILGGLSLSFLFTFLFVPYLAMSQSISIPSTSPTANEDIVDVQELTVNALAGDVITFSEYPLGTAISNQYAEQGIFRWRQPVYFVGCGKSYSTGLVWNT